MSHAAFLADIIAHPDDDAPRLIYADWLEIQGGADNEARAEFIRVQCELAGFERRFGQLQIVYPTQPWRDSPEAGKLLQHTDRLRYREQELIVRHASVFVGDEWTWPNKQLPINLTWSRGFIEEISLPGSLWLERGDDLVRRAPLRRVRLTTWTHNEMDRLWERMGHMAGHTATGLLVACWPGIAFEVPPCPMPVPDRWTVAIGGVPVGVAEVFEVVSGEQISAGQLVHLRDTSLP